MYAYFSVIVINPDDWEGYLDSQDSLPAALTYDPAGTQTPCLQGGANATLLEFYFCSESGYPQDGAASIIVTGDTVDAEGNEHRETLHYVGRVIGGEAFRFDPSQYPVRLNVY